jgi:TctA family transporter
MLKLRYGLLFPTILVFSAIGVYSLNNSAFDVALMAMFGVLGYVFTRLHCEPAPLMLAFILSPMMEESLRRAMLLSRGDPTVLVTRPISLAFLLSAALLLLAVVAPAVRRRREEAFQEA